MLRYKKSCEIEWAIKPSPTSTMQVYSLAIHKFARTAHYKDLLFSPTKLMHSDKKVSITHPLNSNYLHLIKQSCTIYN
jgi:hypothetical protein